MSMKIDHFAAFRKQHLTSQEPQGRATEAMAGPSDVEDSLTHLTRPHAERVREPINRKPAKTLEKTDNLTHLTHLTRKNEDIPQSCGSGPLCPACQGSDLQPSPAGGLICQGCDRFLFLHFEPDAPAHPISPLRPCGAFVCTDCHVHSPSPHRETCRLPRMAPCGSRWFWLSPYRAIKCVACEGPANLALVEGWVTAREDQIPDEIFKLLNVETPAQ